MGCPYLNLYVRHDESKFKNTLLYKTQIKYKERNTFSINYELVKSLVYPFIEQQSLNVLYTKTIRKIDFILNSKPEKVTIDLYTNNYPRLGNNRRRWATQNKEQCTCCRKSICRDHSIVICDSCNVNKEV